MKRLFIGLLLVAFMVSCSFSIYAAPGKFNDGHGKSNDGPDKFNDGHGKFNGGPRHQMQEDARQIIHRTAMVLLEAQRAVKYKHFYFGLARSFAHQQKAQELYKAGSYQDAIFHSLRARELAIQVIRENRGRLRPEFYRDEMEQRYARGIPRDEELDRRLDRSKVGKDDDVIHLHFDFDL
jgi:hypothetical protein